MWVVSLRFRSGTQPPAVSFDVSVITDESQTLRSSNECRQLSPGIHKIANWQEVAVGQGVSNYIWIALAYI